MIPKIIHYCWFGKGPKSELVERCMTSWHQWMPDWQYVEWNEESLSQVMKGSESSIVKKGGTWLDYMPKYVREAYEAKKYAFVSDYVRLWALEQYGGLYLDTDVEVIRSFDELAEFSVERLALSEKYVAFIGFEESLAQLPGTCVIGCEAYCQWVKDMLVTYDGAEFIMQPVTSNQKPKFDWTTNVHRLGRRMVAGGLIPNGKEQFIEQWGLHVYDFHYFSPLTSTRVMRKTKDTFAIHHFAASWHDQKGSIAKLQASPVVCEIINVLIQIKRYIKRYV